MKKKIFTLLGVAGAFIGFSQPQASTSVENKNALLEEFTGIYCTFCPDGHVIAKNLKQTHGNDFYVVKYHTGGYANPSGGDPDFRTSFGGQIAGQTDLTGYPAGTVNRTVFPALQQGNGTAMGRGGWSNAVDQILAETAYVNLAVEASVDEQTRELTVQVDYYYTGNSPSATNKLNVVLMQHNIEGPQTGASTFNPSSILSNGMYNHVNMVRHLLTGQWGVDITSTTTGSTNLETYTYTIPADLNNIDYILGNLEVVAFIAEDQQTVANVSGAEVTVTNHQFNTEAALTDIESINDQCAGSASSDLWVKVENNGANDITSMDFEYSVNGGTASTYNWTGTLSYGNFEYITLPTFNFTVQQNNSVDIDITAVNGGNDDQLTNNTISATFDLAPTSSNDIVVEIKTDNYPGETSWRVEDGSGAVVESGSFPGGSNAGGPDANTVHTYPVTLSGAGCYKLIVEDSYGDGMALGTNTYARIVDGGTTVVNIPGDGFSDQDERSFESDGTASINDVTTTSFSVFPNPNNGNFQVTIGADFNTGTYNLVDTKGRTIFNNGLNSNQKEFSIQGGDIDKGVYFLNIQLDDNKITKKVIVK